MQISAPLSKRYVNEYDIVFQSGQMMPLTLDLAAGDTFENDGTKLIINLVAKPGITDPTQTYPAEDIVVFLSHVVSIQHRVREITDLTPDQKLEWDETIRKMGGGTVQ
jgi:hypothetical protein